jgi:Zn-dependent protease
LGFSSEMDEARSSSQLAPGELMSIIVAWIVVSVALSIGDFIGGTATAGSVAAVFIASATAFVFHEMGHKSVAIRLGYVAHFKVWIWGLVITLVSALVTLGSFIFGSPGAVYISPRPGYGERRSDPNRDNMLISAAGPGVNLAFAVFFFLLLLFVPTSGFIADVAVFGFSLNVGLGSFNMLPIPPLDGFKVFKNNILVGLLIALPLWAMFLYFILGVF